LIRDVVYFADASLGSALAVLLVRSAVGALGAPAFAGRGRPDDPRIHAAMALAAAP
jgi:hypothetical protein